MGVFTRKYKIVEKARNLFLRVFVRIIRRKHQKQIRYISLKRKLEDNSYDLGKLNAHMSLFGRLTKRIDSGWYKYFSSITGVEDERYLPPDIYFQFIKPVLNQVQFVNTLNDKNLYDKVYPQIKSPHVFIRYINGCFYDNHYNRLSDKVIESDCISAGLIDPSRKRLIVKPSVESGRGKQVERLILENESLFDKDGLVVSLNDLVKKYRCDFLIQKEVKQHSSCERLSPGSLNTIRIFTYRSVKDDAIIPLHICQRIGKPGSVIDGFLHLGIEQDGRYKHYAIDNGANTSDNVNGLPIKSLG